ncbi:MAG: SRPBCC domain-containing protein [Sneathiella sp.]|nr:SRPBCC domain-containing protein [Sneathiella sp.]
MTNITITKTAFFQVSRETVWSFLTTKENLGKWFHPAEKDLVEGEDYALIGTADDGAKMKICWGTVLQMIAPEKLVWSFTVNPLNGVMTTVSWDLEEVNGGTKLTLTHSGLDATGNGLELISMLDAGWDMHIGKLRKANK